MGRGFWWEDEEDTSMGAQGLAPEQRTWGKCGQYPQVVAAAVLNSRCAVPMLFLTFAAPVLPRPSGASPCAVRNRRVQDYFCHDTCHFCLCPVFVYIIPPALPPPPPALLFVTVSYVCGSCVVPCPSFPMTGAPPLRRSLCAVAQKCPRPDAGRNAAIKISGIGFSSEGSTHAHTRARACASRDIVHDLNRFNNRRR